MKPFGKFALVAAALSAIASPASAHGMESGFVLLLPTGYYLIGGTASVAASFLLILFVPPATIENLARARLTLGSVPRLSPTPLSVASFLFLLLLLAAGVYGSRDPLENPLPLTIWTIWWIGIALLHAVLGNIWSALNPWCGPYRLADRLCGGRLSRQPPFNYPQRLSYWPAIIFFLGFAWFELVYPAPDDPERLAKAVALYWSIAFVGILLFGEQAWLDRAEPFSVFFRLVAGLSPLIISPATDNRSTIALGIPGARLLDKPPLPLSGILFVLLTLSSVSFDGLSKTFWWLALGGINPLEFPGRTALIERNTIGLLLAFAMLVALYSAAVRLGWIIGLMRMPLGTALGALVYSILPISIGFHFAHYLTALLVDGQYAIAAASDLFGVGSDLFGTDHLHVTTSFMNTYQGVRIIWNAQVVAIVLGHVLAVALAHALALRHFGESSAAALTEMPLALFMVLYTLFGLWLLSTPTVG